MTRKPPAPQIDHERLLDRLCNVDAEVIYFPVRHHSPACARAVRELIQECRPSKVLIEGPSDFNPHLAELDLDHELPVAIYSYFRDMQGNRLGAFYPFCEYSPEWMAIKAARKVDATVRFIDLPWSEVARVDRTEHRYADGALRRTPYLEHVCEKLGVEGFDEFWDKIAEVEESLAVSDLMTRVHSYCYHSRLWEGEIGASDRVREKFMADCVREQMEEPGKILVVTGGFHSAAIVARVEGIPCVGIEDPPRASDIAGAEVDADLALECGITLTPYAYSRLDGLAGYDAGMPSPGFYDHVWRFRGAEIPNQRDANSEVTDSVHRPLLQSIVAAMRQRGQAISTADMIAVETTAQSLAAIRGRDTVWRTDLIDAVTASLVKDETAVGVQSPFLSAVHDVMRGDRRGRLAAGTRRPPLVQEIFDRLEQSKLMPQTKQQRIAIDLLEPAEIPKSQLLHQMRVLSISGFSNEIRPDFIERKDLASLQEVWLVRWSPEFEATCVESARYGASLDSATSATLLERAESDKLRRATDAVMILIDAAHCGIDTLDQQLLDNFERLISTDSDFLSVSGCLDHLLYLFCFDETLATAGNPRIATLLSGAFERALWLLESLGEIGGSEKELVIGLRAMADTFSRGRQHLDQSDEEFSEVLTRVTADDAQMPIVRGATAGMLWKLGRADAGEIVAQMRGMTSPQSLGDFLTGVFALAREVAQRSESLVQSIDEVLAGFDGDEFLEALPALRLAFTSFTPREKHYMLRTLFDSLNLTNTAPLPALQVDEESAAESLALESRVFDAIRKYGLRLDGADV